MGCTSSALSTVDPKTSSATERKLEMESTGSEDGIKDMKRNGSEELNGSTEISERVLPASDTVETNLDLDNSNESAAINQQIKCTLTEAMPAKHVIESNLIEETSTTSPAVATEEMFIEPQLPKEPSEGIIVEDVEGQEYIEGENEIIVDTGQIIQDEVINCTEVVTQDKESEESPNHDVVDRRATRWEALADVVAELPPKLTVDPITGQIYAVTKRD